MGTYGQRDLRQGSDYSLLENGRFHKWLWIQPWRRSRVLLLIREDREHIPGIGISRCKDILHKVCNPVCLKAGWLGKTHGRFKLPALQPHLYSVPSLLTIHCVDLLSGAVCQVLPQGLCVHLYSGFSAFFRLCPNTTANVSPPFSITSLHDKSSHWGAMQERLS